MSVVVFDTKVNRMYADTVTTLGSVACYNSPKLKRVNFDNGWTMLIGAIGIASHAVIPMKYLCSFVADHIQFGRTIQDLGPNKVTKFSIPVFDNMVDLQTKSLGNFDPDFTILAALTDGVDTVVGVMDHSLVPCWGITPLPGEPCICVASKEVTAAFYATEGATIQRLYRLSAVHYIGNRYNTFEGLSFHDNV